MRYFRGQPNGVITSARLQTLPGTQDSLRLWNRGASCGVLTLKAGDGIELVRALGLKETEAD